MGLLVLAVVQAVAERTHFGAELQHERLEVADGILALAIFLARSQHRIGRPSNGRIGDDEPVGGVLEGLYRLVKVIRHGVRPLYLGIAPLMITPLAQRGLVAVLAGGRGRITGIPLTQQKLPLRVELASALGHTGGLLVAEDMTISGKPSGIGEVLRR
jgi:hypothetical protein